LLCFQLLDFIYIHFYLLLLDLLFDLIQPTYGHLRLFLIPLVLNFFILCFIIPQLLIVRGIVIFLNIINHLNYPLKFLFILIVLIMDL